MLSRREQVCSGSLTSNPFSPEPSVLVSICHSVAFSEIRRRTITLGMEEDSKSLVIRHLMQVEKIGVRLSVLMLEGFNKAIERHIAVSTDVRGNGRVGDPTKKSRPNYPDQNQQRDSSMLGDVLHTVNIVELVDERGQKRKGLDDGETTGGMAGSSLGFYPHTIPKPYKKMKR
jgi:hypothetical protein